MDISSHSSPFFEKTVFSPLYRFSSFVRIFWLFLRSLLLSSPLLTPLLLSFLLPFIPSSLASLLPSWVEGRISTWCDHTLLFHLFWFCSPPWLYTMIAFMVLRKFWPQYSFHNFLCSIPYYFLSSILLMHILNHYLYLVCDLCFLFPFYISFLLSF